MHIEKFDLLRGMDRDFIKDFMGILVKEVYEEGNFLFRQGDKANYFFILVKGHVKISIGDSGHVVHIVDHAGEAFGWSSLLGRDIYSASAECRMPTKLLKIDIERLQPVFEKHPTSGLIFYKRLAGILGNRLIQSYKMISTGYQAQIPVSFGSRQVSEAGTAG